MVALFGRYEYRRELGRGASGRVFAVSDLAEAGAERAIKVVAPSEGARLTWEFERLCRIDHPRVARVRELLRVESVVHAPFALPAGCLLLVEDLGPGAPLSRVGLEASDPAERARRVLRVALGAAEALAAVHDAGLVHGDIKPDNLLVDENGSTTLVDLGFAAPPALGQLPRGTPRFMAPELFAGLRSPAADVYALGALLFDWLAGDAEGRSWSRADGPFVTRSATALADLVPQGLVQLIAAFLERDPQLRPADGHAALSALVPLAEALGLSGTDGAALVSGLSGAGATRAARAARARTLPFIGHAGLVERVARELDRPGVLLVRGARGAGRSRLVREALRGLQLACADGGRALPTVVRSFEALEHVRDVHAVLWLAPEEADVLRELESALRVAALGDAKLSVVLECEPQLEHAAARALDLPALAADDQRTLLARLLEPAPLNAAVCAAAQSASQGLAGRLCELAAEALIEGRDLADPRSFRAQSWDPDQLSLSDSALQLAGLFAWWGGGLSPELCAHSTLTPHERDAAFAELWAKALLSEVDGALVLAPVAARAARRRTFAARETLLAPLAARAQPESGFALFALARVPEACERFEREAQALRAEGNVAGAQALLQEATALTQSSALRLAWADAERACTRYEAALGALEGDGSAEALLLRAEVLRLSGRAADARRCLAPLLSDASEGASNVASQGASNVGNEDASNVASEGASNVASQGASNVGNEDASNVGNEDASNVASEDVSEANLAEGRLPAGFAGREGRARALPINQARALAARLDFDAGELARARAGAEQLVDAADLPSAVRALEVCLLVELAAGSPGRESAEALLTKATELRSERALARALSLRSQLRARCGERASALSDAQAALRHARRAGELHEAASCALNLGLLQWEAGELGLALETLRESAYRLSRIDRPADLVRVLFNVGALAALVGDDARAEVVLAQAERLADAGGDAAARALIAVAQAELGLHKGQLELAGGRLARALEQLPDQLPSLRALLAARLCQVWLLREDVPRARALLELARSSSLTDDFAPLLELQVAEIRTLLAEGDAASAERVASAGMELAGARAPFGERVRFLLAAIDAARAADYEPRARERTHLCRALLEAALSSLTPALRARMRERPEYARVLAAANAAGAAPEGSEAARWRRLVVASRRLFGSPQRARIAEQVAEIALELVHAERALVVALSEQGQLELRAQAALALAPEAPLYSRSVVERVASERTSLVTLEASDDLRLRSAQSLHALSIRSVLAVPIEAPRERLVLYLDDRLRAQAFGPDDLAIAEDLAALAQQALRAAHVRSHEARRAHKAEQQAEALSRALAAGAPGAGASATLIGVSRALNQVTTQARRIARSDVSVLLTGDSGTGKELLARLIHDESPRRGLPFVAENCAALPDALLESALFGHLRGAFTGAERNRRGLFEVADRGTLFLDEVGEMSQPLQAKLLRVLQEGEFRPLGSERPRRADVRVIAATRRDLVAAVRDGQFREDLYYRLAVVTLELPALSARREDIPLLVRHFVDKHAAGRKVRVSSAALRAFVQRDYPGNVRQLENEVRRALALCEDDRIEERDLPQAPGARSVSEAADELDLHAQIDALSARLVEEALGRAAGNVTRAAQLLGISRFGLQKMLKRLGRLDQPK